jgi:predicted nucleic acid-binding protein
LIAAGVLVDTDVLIWHLRGYPQATRRLDEMSSLILSAISYLEVLQGIRNKSELAVLKKMLQHRRAVLLPVTEAITLLATELMEALTLSHGLQMGDALIAATALRHQQPVLTANLKHFTAVPRLRVEAFSLA